MFKKLFELMPREKKSRNYTSQLSEQSSIDDLLQINCDGTESWWMIEIARDLMEFLGI